MFLSQNGTSDVFVGLNGGAFNANITLSSPWKVNVWNHLAMSADGTNIKIYLNGLQVASVANPNAALAGTSYSVGIGRDPGFGFPFNGLLDEIRVYNRALTPAEIARLYWNPARDRVPYQTRARIVGSPPSDPTGYASGVGAATATGIGLATGAGSATGTGAATGASPQIVAATTGTTGALRKRLPFTPLFKTYDDRRDPLNLGLVGHWSMDAETFNGTRLLDLSGRDNHGTLVASPWLVPGRVGQTALSFNGGPQYVATPAAFAFAFPSVTYSFWVNLPSTSMTGMFFEDAWHWLGPGEDMGVGACVGNGDGDTPGNHLLVPLWGVSWQDTFFNIGLGWHHIAVALSGGKTNAYLDGARIFVGSSSIAGPSVGTFTIGRDNDPNGFRYLNAQMDDVRVYNRALTPAEISRLYWNPARDRVPYQTRARIAKTSSVISRRTLRQRTGSRA